MTEERLPAHVRALLRPEAYPHPVDAIRLVQTHISYVLLAGEHVYKLKKPLDLGFLDFTTLAKRRQACEDEVRLNRRTCESTYLGVVPVGDDGRIGVAHAVDYAVHMRRLPDEGMMDRLLARDAVTHAMLGRLVALIADFHARADTSERIRRIGGHEALADDWRENFEQLRPFAGDTVAAADLDRLESWVRDWFSRETPILLRREDEGRVRDCHGDLRADAVCFDPADPDRICVYDCIEFNERFRFGDTGLDIAFLAMDLDFRGRRDLSDLLIGLYAAASGDTTLPLVLPFYKAYRACVRAKVESFLSAEPEVPSDQRHAARERAGAYMRLAVEYATREPLRALVLVMGPSGSGKSVLAGALASRSGAVLLSTDIVRKQAERLAPTERRPEALDTGVYSPESRERVYEALRALAASFLDEGRGVVLDGTYIERRLREPVLELARLRGLRLLVVECSAPESVIAGRQRQRLDQSWSTSDARMDVYLSQTRRYEPPDEVPPDHRLRIDTTAPLEDQLSLIAALL